MDEQAIYQAALAMPSAAERNAYLAEACEDNTWLRQHLAARIEGDLRAGITPPPPKRAFVAPAELKRWMAELKNQPQNFDLVRQCGMALADHARFDEAVEYWLKVEDAFPEDSEATAMVTQLTIEKSRLADGARKPTKKELAAAATIKADAPVVPAGPSLVNTSIPLTPIQQLERAHRDCPAMVEVYSQLVPLYLEKGREYDAERILAKGVEATGNDPVVVRLWEEVRLLRMDKVVALARKQTQVASPSAEAQAALNDALSKQERLELEISEARVKRSPDDAGSARELGARLLKKGRAEEACQHLELALKDPNERAAAALCLGDCHRDMDNLPEALKYYRIAVEAAEQMAQGPLEEQALFQAGKLAAELQMTKVAQQYLGDLLDKDPQHAEAKAIFQALPWK